MKSSLVETHFCSITVFLHEWIGTKTKDKDLEIFLIYLPSRFVLKKMPFLKIRLKSGLWDLFIHILVAQNHSPPNLSMGPF